MTSAEALSIVAEARLRGQQPDLRGANLSGADLSAADLRGTDLHGADLHGADLSGAILSKNWTVRQWSGCGTRRRMTTLAVDPGGWAVVWCGCFEGTVDEFAAAVEDTHANNRLHLDDYRAIVADMRRIVARETA